MSIQHPTPGDPDRAYRLSDAERSAAVAALADAFAEGRLDAEEFETRMSAASQARRSDELEPLFADLPGPLPVAIRMPSREQRRAARRMPTSPSGYPAAPGGYPIILSSGYPAVARSGYPAVRTPRHVAGGRPRRPAPVAVFPLLFLLMIGTSAAFLLPLMFVGMILIGHLAAPHRSR